ncbi:MAG: hypothetical protein ABIJ08_02435 [Nanoarchaeota archaeon]
MQKKGQVVAVFAIVGILLVFIFAIILQLRLDLVEYNLERSKISISSTQHDLIFLNTYFEDCLEQVSKKAILLTAHQGGYIDTSDDMIHGDYGESEYIQEDGYNLPYYLNGSEKYTIPLDEIEEKIARYAVVEFERCINKSILKNLGFDVELPSVDYAAAMFNFNVLDVNSNVTINQDDIRVHIDYPINISKGKSKITMDKFSVEIPSRLSNISHIVLPILRSIVLDYPDPTINDYFCKNVTYLENSIYAGLINISAIHEVGKEYKIKFIGEEPILQFAVKNVNITCTD